MKTPFRVLPEQKELLVCFEYIPETEEAYATRKWVEESGGVVFWTQVLSD